MKRVALCDKYGNGPFLAALGLAVFVCCANSMAALHPAPSLFGGLVYTGWSCFLGLALALGGETWLSLFIRTRHWGQNRTSSLLRRVQLGCFLASVGMGGIMDFVGA